MLKEEVLKPTETDNLLHLIALQATPHVGSRTARNLIAYCGSAQAIFQLPLQRLLNIPTIGEKTARAIADKSGLLRAEQELKFIEKHQVRVLPYYSKEFPQHYKLEHDAPLLLYVKGTADLNAPKGVAIVGTRKPSSSGRAITEQLAAGVATLGGYIISGLAYGIDICAHKAAIEHGAPTVAVVGHGLGTIYPAAHSDDAQRIIERGGAIVSEYFSTTRADRNNFPARNRIIAGLSHVLVLVESAISGGGMITAEIAFTYQREVFAVPGSPGSPTSCGCNALIKRQKAYLVEDIEDIQRQTGWCSAEGQKLKQDLEDIYKELPAQKQAIVKYLRYEPLEFDSLAIKTGFHPSDLSLMLLELELDNLVKALPGKAYKLA